MKILLIAPQPFYQERGTPIAVNLLLQALSARGDRIDLLTLHEGRDLAYPGVTIHRIPAPIGIHGIKPGLSLKKLVCDLFLFVKALRMARCGGYQLVHAVEESAFIAIVIQRLWRVPYIFDMDSSLPRQILEKHRSLRVFAPLFEYFEALAIRRARAVVAVCDALAEIAQKAGARKIFILRDISLLTGAGNASNLNLKKELGLTSPCFMYIGNLEVYQGIDLLLESFSIFRPTQPAASLVIVGGAPADIRHYREKAARIGLEKGVYFTGPRPVTDMSALFQEADILVSPRISGNNTPMKIYSYLESGKPILATDLPTHTQVLTLEVAALAAPDPKDFAEGMRQLTKDPERARTLARNARRLAEERHSAAVFERTVREIYGWIDHSAEITTLSNT